VQREIASGRTILYSSWEEIKSLLNLLSELISNDGKPDLIVGIQRGGLIPSIVLSHSLKIQNIDVLSIKRTENDCVNANKKKVELLTKLDSTFDGIKGRDVLLIDDICGSGDTLRLAFNILKKYQAERLRTLVCFVNLDNWEPQNKIMPSSAITYIGKEIRGWMVFPWEMSVAADENN